MQVDEDGARRLQSILDRNRESGAALADVFGAARTALASLKKELSESAGIRDFLSGWNAGGPGSFPLAGNNGSSPGTAGGPNLSSAGSLSGGKTVISAAADLSGAEEAFHSFRTRMESERPKLSVNTSGITSAVSSAVASVRAMLNSIHITVPVTARAQLDTSGLQVPTGGNGGGGFGNRVQLLGTGGRVTSPTLAMIAEEGKTEYVIPADNEARAVPLLRSLIAELSDSARGALFSGGIGIGAGAGAGMGSGRSPASVQAPVNIHVTAPAGSPEAVARSVYDTAQRSLLKTLKGVFAG